MHNLPFQIAYSIESPMILV